MNYLVLYNDVIIGKLTVTDRYIYVPDKEKIEQVDNSGTTIMNFLKERIEETTIPFFESRIKNCSRFNNATIGYHMDGYSLVKED